MARLSLAFLYGLIEAQNQRIAELEKDCAQHLAKLTPEALGEEFKQKVMESLHQYKAEQAQSGWTKGARPSRPTPVRNEVPEYVLQRRKAMEAAKAAAMSGQKTVRV